MLVLHLRSVHLDRLTQYTSHCAKNVRNLCEHYNLWYYICKYERTGYRSMLIDRVLKHYPAAAVLTAVDANLKDRAEKSLGAAAKNLGSTGIQLKRVHNPGILMGGGKEDPSAVMVFTGSLLTMFLLGNRKALHGREGAVKSVSANLIAAGAASNLRDRIKYGYVVDYFSLPVKKIRNVYFNLGDLMILSGSLLYILSGFSEKDRQ